MQTPQLTQQHLGCCESILQRTLPALEFAQQCKDCGYPVEDLIEQLAEHARIAQSTKDTFFPPQA